VNIHGLLSYSTKSPPLTIASKKNLSSIFLSIVKFIEIIIKKSLNNYNYFDLLKYFTFITNIRINKVILCIILQNI